MDSKVITSDFNKIIILFRTNDQEKFTNEDSKSLIKQAEKQMKILKYYLNIIMNQSSDLWEITPEISKEIDVIENQKAMYFHYVCIF